MSKSSKEDKVFNIALKVFELEEEKGHLGWKTTEVVERSGVSRSLIYRYFGGNKEEILLEAVKAFIYRFYGFDNDEESTFIEKLQGARRLLEDYPQAAMFYQKWRTTDSFIKDEFIATERKYQQVLKEANPKMTESEIVAFHTCLHGFVTAPFLESGKIPETFSAFLSLGKLLQ